MPEQTEDDQKKKGFFANLGFFQKVIIGICFIIFLILVWNFFTGNVRSVYDFVAMFLVGVALVTVLYYVIKSVFGLFHPKPFSPRESFFTKVVNVARDMKPDNVYDLYFSGDVGRQRTKYGRIVGLTAVARFVGKPKTDSNGKIIYSNKKDPYNRDRKLPEYEYVNLSEDYDTVFVVRRGMIFPNFHYLRVPPSLHSTLNGDVEIYDINPQPYGRWEYPFKVFQTEIKRVMLQHQLEAIIETHEFQHDFASVLVDSALGFNPAYEIARRNAEQLTPVRPQ